MEPSHDMLAVSRRVYSLRLPDESQRVGQSQAVWASETGSTSCDGLMYKRIAQVFPRGVGGEALA
eukprot:CAMPEP_0184724572 /NCGR_PEP_ID=MMETSP0314-20130426/28318_1 /TAXON_ID=38298 /ORGANISM="Rhodella maculata, Strain CCMP 736" /LENGTH=64 /DNA_ID=CAMNT_0027189587 /DNA_START=76 /DNA_END=267 /DNA_ORIENTATION=-